MRVFANIWAVAAVALCVQAANAQTDAPDAVLVNGKIITVDSSGRVAEALSIRGDRIAAIGSTKDIRKLAGPHTTVIDLGGRTVIPGLIDSHLHAIRDGLTYWPRTGPRASGVKLDWSGITTLQGALDDIRAAARTTPPGAWISVIGGWNSIQFAEKRAPTSKELGEAAPDHPVYVQQFYDFAVLNPLAMKMLKITADTKVPPAGKVLVDANGDPTGVIDGGASVPTLSRITGRLPKPTSEEQLEGARAFFRVLNRTGITGIVDGGGGGLFPTGYQSLFTLWKRGALTLRVRYTLMSQKRGEELADIKNLLQLIPPRWGDDWLRFNGTGEVIVWGMHDGSKAGGAFNPPPQTKQALFEFASWAAGNGYTIQIHASSSSSAEQILDLFERVNKTAPIADLRWMILHIEDASDDALRRMKALGMGFGAHARLYLGGDEYVRVLGEKIARRSPPIMTASRMGVMVAGGTDSVLGGTYNPFVSLQWFVTGKTASGTPTRGPDELPTRMEALKIYTLNSAWTSFDEKARGSLEPGKLADLAVLDKDYATVPVEAISTIESLLTMVGGKVVYAAGPYKALESSP